ncbi:MAG: universal stress protein [candidate division WOR-3 bacterium]
MFNLNKLLLYLDNLRPEVLDFTLDLAGRLSAKIFALYVVDENLVRKKVKSENKEREKVKEEMEEIAWQELYQVEDLFSIKGIKISLLLFEGKVNKILREVMESYEIDLLVVSRNCQLNIGRFLEINKEKGVIVL